MTHRLLALATGFFVLAASQPSHAGPHAGARILFHLQEAETGLCSGAIPSCASMTTEVYYLAVPLFAYVVIQQANAVAGIGGVSFGIGYSGAPGGPDILSWTSCADNEVLSAGWPAHGSGVILSWNSNNCQHNVAPPGDSLVDGATVAGYFYLNPYAPSQLQVRPHPDDSAVLITDCDGGSDNIATAFPSRLGAAGFGGPAGYNPCGYRDGGCVISGPEFCQPGTTGHVYITSMVMTATSTWTISGQGTIVGPSEDVSSVTVTANEPGTFVLAFSGSDGVHQGYNCSKTVTVEEPIPVDAVSWGRIKALYRSP